MTKREGYDPAHPWTDDAIIRAAASDFAVREVRFGRMTPEEGLISAITTGHEPAPAVRAALLKHGREVLGLGRLAREHEAATAEPERSKCEAERERYHTDDEYRGRRLESFRARKTTPGYRERDAARKRAARARDRRAS